MITKQSGTYRLLTETEMALLGNGHGWYRFGDVDEPDHRLAPRVNNDLPEAARPSPQPETTDDDRLP